MTFAENLMELRKQHGLSQEALGDIVDVSRQTVSKWELGLTTPELDKLVGLAEYFDITLDALVGREAERPKPVQQRPAAVRYAEPYWYYEYKSQRTLFGLPLVHIHFHNRGFARAKGIIAIGNQATGFIALGGLAVGLIAFGGLALGLLALGGLAIGLLLALGGVAVGGVALGGLAVGAVAFGGVALSYVAVGGCVSGTYALGNVAAGSRLSISDLDGLRVKLRETVRQSSVQEVREMVRQRLLEEAAGTPGWVVWLITRILIG